LNDEGRKMVKDFVKREFREKAKEEEEGSKIIWFKNTTNLQSVRSLEHFHVLVRDVDEEILERWMK
jgi:rRNA-processing protein FCF1